MAVLSRRSALVAGAASGAIAALRFSSALASDAARPSPPIPPEIRPSEQGVVAFGAGVRTAHFLPGLATATRGYNGAFLGPRLRLRRGQTVTID